MDERREPPESHEPDEEPEVAGEGIPPEPEAAPGPVEETRKTDLNTATAAELSRLPGITAAQAKRIVEYRTAVHPFREPADLMNVRGVSRAMYERIADQITALHPGEPPAVDVSVESVLSPEPVRPPAPETHPAAAVPPLTPERAIAREPASRGTGWLAVLAVGLVSALAGACLALAVLAAVNGTLQFGRAATVRSLRAEVRQLGSRVEGLSTEAGRIQGRLDEAITGAERIGSEIEAMQARLEDLDRQLATAGREVEAVRSMVGEMEDSILALQVRLGAVEGQLGRMSEDLLAARQAVQRFDGFLAGLRSLLDEAQTPGPTLPGSQPGAITPIPTPSATPVATVRPTPTATP